MFAHIIAEANDGYWSAWFGNKPECVCDGHNLAIAMSRLIDIHGPSSLQWREIIPIGKATCEGHAEFLIPLANSMASACTASAN